MILNETRSLISRSTYCFFLVLKHFVGLLEAAALLHTLPLDVALPKLLQEPISPWKTLEERVCILPI